MEEKQTLGEVIETQALGTLYDTLNDIDFFKYKLETVPKICRLITGDCVDNAEKPEQLDSMFHYTEYLVKELESLIDKALKIYSILKRQNNGTKA